MLWSVNGTAKCIPVIFFLPVYFFLISSWLGQDFYIITRPKSYFPYLPYLPLWAYFPGRNIPANSTGKYRGWNLPLNLVHFSFQFSSIKNFSAHFYRVYWNQAAAYLSLYFSFQFSNIKHFCHTFLMNCEAYKAGTWYTREQWVDVLCKWESGCCCLFVPLFLHFSFQFSIKNFHHAFLRNCVVYKVETWSTW